MGCAVRCAGLACVVAFAAAGQVRAQEVPAPGFTFGPGEIVQHETNFFRSSGAFGVPIESATSYETDLMGAFQQTYGREQVSASATIGRVLYPQLGEYDFTRQDIRAALKSNLPYNVDVSIGIARTAQLAHFADVGGTTKDIITFNAANALVDFPLEVDWRGVLGGNVSQLTNSATAFQTQDLNTAELDGGIRFQPSTGNHVDLLVRSVEGTYPNNSPASFIPPGYHDLGAGLRADWTFSGASHLQGSAGFVRRSNDELLYLNTTTGQTQLLDRNFSGPAYDLTYLWQATAASRLTVYGLRSNGPSGDNVYVPSTTETFRLTPAYQLSAKIEVDAYYQWTKRNYFTDVYDVVNSQPPGTTRVDYSRYGGLSMIWNPRRWLKVALDIHREDRDSTIAAYNYGDNVATLSLQSSF